MNKLTKLATIVMVSGGVLGAAYASHESARHENDAAAINTVKVSMNDALKAALAEVPGKPTLARFRNADGQQQWRIEVASNKGIYDLTIDAETGRLLHKEMDKPDHEEEEGED